MNIKLATIKELARDGNVIFTMADGTRENGAAVLANMRSVATAYMTACRTRLNSGPLSPKTARWLVVGAESG